jgi:transposase-like protein
MWRQFSASEKRWPRPTAVKSAANSGHSRVAKHIYSSMLSSWRKQLYAADSAALAPQKRGPKPDASAQQIKHLNRDVARLRAGICADAPVAITTAKVRIIAQGRRRNGMYASSVAQASWEPLQGCAAAGGPPILIALRKHLLASGPCPELTRGLDSRSAPSVAGWGSGAYA